MNYTIFSAGIFGKIQNCPRLLKSYKYFYWARYKTERYCCLLLTDSNNIHLEHKLMYNQNIQYTNNSGIHSNFHLNDWGFISEVINLNVLNWPKYNLALRSNHTLITQILPSRELLVPINNIWKCFTIIIYYY